MNIVRIAFCFGTLAGAVAVVDYALRPPTGHIGLGVDPSLSVKRDCSGLRAMAETLTFAKSIQEGSTLTLLAMGDPEPLRLFDKPLPISSDNVFGRDEAAFKKRRENFFAELQAACEATPTIPRSPVLRLVSRGIAHLRGRGCASAGLCYFTFQTDLNDDVDPKLGPVLQRAAEDPNVELTPELAGAIDNAGIHVQFCGTSEVQAPKKSEKPKRRHASPDSLARIWRGLFTDPNLVTFQPYCGQ